MTWLKRILVLAALAGGLSLAPSEAHAQAQAEWLDVEVGQSFIFQGTRPIARILVSDDIVAELKLIEEGQFQVRGLDVGTTDLWVWYRDERDNPVRYELTVHRDLSDLVRRVDQVVGTDAPLIYPLKERIVVEGSVPDVETLERVAGMARVYDPEFVNLMSVTGDHQIQIEVIFAEVNRTALREMGFSYLFGKNALGGGVNPPSALPTNFAFNQNLSNLNNGLVPAAVPGTFQILGTAGLGTNGSLTTILSVLEQHNISKVLARPTLTALSGQQAEFLAGVEVPIPVAQNGNRITIEFKEYGVKVVFVPTVLGSEVVDMRVYVEVSDIDSSKSLTLTGIEIPAFVSRKSQSHLRVESGLTFAMAGMLYEGMSSNISKIPVLGDIPIAGALFRYVKHERNETELIIFVTPRLVRPMAPDEVPVPPGMSEDNNPNDFELFWLALDHRVGSRSEDSTGEIGLVR